MTNPEDDPELESMFLLSDEDEEEEESDDEYFGASGRILQEVELPYNRADRILQANRELFSEPPMKKKQPSRVTFNSIPTVISYDEIENMIELFIPIVCGDERSSSDPVNQRRLTNRRRNTPSEPRSYRSSSTSGQLVVPRLIIPLSQSEPLASNTANSNWERIRRKRKKVCREEMQLEDPSE